MMSCPKPSNQSFNIEGVGSHKLPPLTEASGEGRLPFFFFKVATYSLQGNHWGWEGGDSHPEVCEHHKLGY